MSTYIATLSFGTPANITSTQEFTFKSRAVKTGTVVSHAREAAEKEFGTDKFLVTAVRAA